MTKRRQKPAHNADILDNAETWPGQSNTRGDFGGHMLGEFMLGGSLLERPGGQAKEAEFKLKVKEI